MLANRLNVLLAERQLPIKQVVDETEISRSSISNIVNNPNANISTETIDILCNYLEVTPSDFFVYSPYSIKFGMNETNETMLMSVTHKKRQQLFDLDTYIRDDDSGEEEKARLKYFDIYISIYSELGEETLPQIYDSLAVIFKTQLTNAVINHFEKSFSLKDLKMYSTKLSTSKKSLSINVLDYLTKLNKDQYTVALDLPWADLEKKAKIDKNKHLRFI